MKDTAARSAVLAACTFLIVSSTHAAEPFDGRWAAELSACAGEGDVISPLVVTSYALRWREAGCAIRTSYRVGAVWHIGAHCWAEGAISNVPIKLQLRGQRLLLDWAGARAEELQRCP